MSYDEGVCYFTIIPSENNPFIEHIKRFRDKYDWRGISHSPSYAFIPFRINFASHAKKTPEDAEHFRKIIGMTLEIVAHKVIEIMLGCIHNKCVEDWLNLLQGTKLLEMEDTVLIEPVYNEMLETFLELYSSGIIETFSELESRYRYTITFTRFGLKGMPIATFISDTFKERLIQRLYDSDIQMSSFKWDLGVNIERKFIWRKPWAKFIEPHI